MVSHHGIVWSILYYYSSVDVLFQLYSYTISMISYIIYRPYTRVSLVRLRITSSQPSGYEEDSKYSNGALQREAGHTIADSSTGFLFDRSIVNDKAVGVY